MNPISTRVGQIVAGDNRFFGRSVFDDLPREVGSASDPLWLALGAPVVTSQHREVARALAIACISPDARAWPLKLTRLLASYGDPLAGHFGGQLASSGKVMGPGAGTQAAMALSFVASEVGFEPTVEAVTAALQTWRGRVGGRVGGFGVPFRERDERRDGVLRLVQGTCIEQGRYFRLHETVVEVMRPQRPNCTITFAAMLLDVGVAPGQVGLATIALMSHVYLAHAIESSEHDGARLNDLPRERVVYCGPARRNSVSESRASASATKSSRS